MAAGIKQVVRATTAFLGAPVEAALVAIPSRSGMPTDTDAAPKQLIVALTAEELVLMASRTPLMGFPTPTGVWRRLPRDTFYVNVASGKLRRRFTLQTGEHLINLQTRTMGGNRRNSAALDAITRAAARPQPS